MLRWMWVSGGAESLLSLLQALFLLSRTWHFESFDFFFFILIKEVAESGIPAAHFYYTWTLRCQLRRREEEEDLLLPLAFMDSSRDPPASDAVDAEFVDLSTPSKQIPDGWVSSSSGGFCGEKKGLHLPLTHLPLSVFASFGCRWICSLENSPTHVERVWNHLCWDLTLYHRNILLKSSANILHQLFQLFNV